MDRRQDFPFNSHLGVLAALALAIRKGWLTMSASAPAPAPVSALVLPAEEKKAPRPAHTVLPDKLPEKLPRFRHPAHQHRMFLNIARFPQSVECDNLNCRRAIQFSETFLSCVRCDQDLCNSCFQRPLDPMEDVVPLAESDDEVDDRVMFSTFRFKNKTVNVRLNKMASKKHPGTPCEHAPVPNRPQDPAQRETFVGVQIGGHSHHHDDDGEDEEYDEDDDDEEA